MQAVPIYSLANMTENESREPVPVQLPPQIFFLDNDPYDPIESNLVLVATKDFSDRSWGAWFGPIQKCLREKIWRGDQTKPIRKCSVDFSGCKWADPVPLLFLSITLMEFEDCDHHVKIILPSDKQSKGDDPNTLVDQQRFLRFLAREGFLQQLGFPALLILPTGARHRGQITRSVVLRHHQSEKGKQPNWAEETITEKDIVDRFHDLDVTLVYDDSTTLPAVLLHFQNVDANLKVLDEIDEWVEQVLIEVLDSVVRDRVPSWAQSGVEYRLLMALRETLHNVAEHAYEKGGYAAVYIRYRIGALGQRMTPETEKAISREESHLHIPIRKGDSQQPFVYYRSGFFEMFVVDAGRGLNNTLRITHPEMTNVNKAMRSIFEDGISRKDKGDRITALGGLHLLAQLLEPVRDHILLMDDDVWWGAELPLPAGPQKAFSVTMNAGGKQVNYPSGRIDDKKKEILYNKPIGSGAVSGFCWIGRHSWLQDTAIKRDKDSWATPSDDAIVKQILLEYIDDYEVSIATVDHRITPFQMSYQYTHAISPCLLFLPGGRWMRSRIQLGIREAITTGALSDDGTLIIGDIFPEEAHTFLAATRDAHGLIKPPFSRIRRLILITRDLKVAVLNRARNNLFVSSPSESEDFVKHNPQLFSPGRSLKHYLRSLRSHDSRRIWDVASPNGTDSIDAAFRRVEVDWHNDTAQNLVLNGYLDFAQTLTHPVCREIYALSLHRLTGLHREQGSNIVAMDALVESTVIRFNAETASGFSSPSSDQGCHQLLVGSILVSGQTENACNEPHTKTYYFFKHPSGCKAQNNHLLCWLGEPNIQASMRLEPPRYRRIGRTPMIAIDGWKAYRIPRFDNKGHSVYAQSPTNSYKIWQEPSRSLMKFGHWSYGGHHDLLTINLLLAFDTELDRVSLAVGGSLARFMFANLFLIFGLTPDKLTDAGKRLLGAIKKEREILSPYLLSETLAARGAILVYPSHAVTDHVIERFLGLVQDDTELKELRSRIRGILPVRRYRSGSGLQVSGLVLEWLQARISSKGRRKPPPAVIFDDAVISGRTYHDLKGLLRDHGFQEIYSLAMLDRQRLPSTRHITVGQRACYWRLDVPTLGGEDHCPLCHALSRVRAFQRQLAFPDLITPWLDSWEERNPATEWGSAGLRPTYLKLRKRKRKFSIERKTKQSREYLQIGGDSQLLSLTNSAGLACWMTEMHVNTARDDLATTFPEREPDLSPQIRIELLASQLLLFMGEFDLAQARSMRLAILEALWSFDIKQPDMATSLGVLALLACETDELKEAVSTFCAEKGTGMLNGRHSDFLLFIAYCINQGLIADCSTFTRASRLLKSKQTRADILYRFHRETMDVSGAAHTPPLCRLVGGAAPLSVEGLLQDQSITASLMQIISLLNEVKPEWLNVSLLKEAYSDLPEEEFAEFGNIASLLDQANKLNGLVSQVAKTIRIDGVDGSLSKSKFKETQVEAQQFLDQAWKLHRAIFRPLGIREMENGKPCAVSIFIDNMIATFNSEKGENKIEQRSVRVITQPNATLNLNKPQLSECFLPWDTDIAAEIKRTLTNIRHASAGKIPCPFDGLNEDGNYDVWILVTLEASHFKITMVNKLPSSVNLPGNPNYHHVYSDYGGGIAYHTDQEKQHITTTVSWAYAHTLADTLQENPNGL